MEFNTGAIRSDDAEHVSYFLVSPIALKRVAHIYALKPPKNKEAHSSINQALIHQWEYLGGDREVDHLAYALYHLFEEIGPTDHMNNESIDYRYDLISPLGLDSLAQTYREGQLKYTAYNCEQGFPIHDLLNHALRHQYFYLSGDRTEDHLGHASWGLAMSMHSEELWPHLNEEWLRGPNCAITDGINRGIDKARIKKLSKTCSVETYNWINNPDFKNVPDELKGSEIVTLLMKVLNHVEGVSGHERSGDASRVLDQRPNRAGQTTSGKRKRKH